MTPRFFEWLPVQRRPVGAQVGIALMAVAVGAGIRASLNPWLGDLITWVFFFPAVLVASFAGGSMAGVVAVLASAAAGEILFVSPKGHLLPASALEIASLFAFLGSSSLLVVVGAALRRALRVLEQKSEEISAARALIERDADAIEEQLTDLTRLHALSTELAGTYDLDVLLHGILDAVISVQSGERGLIELYDRELHVLQVAVSVGHTERALKTWGAVPVGDGNGARGTAAARRARVIVEDIETDPLFDCYRDEARLAGFRSVWSTPLLTRQGDLVGVLSTQFSHVHRPTQREIRLVDLYARLAADAIHAAQLLQRAERAREDAEKARLLSDLHADNSPLAIVEWDADYHVIRWSAEAERVFGWTAVEVLGKRIDECPLVFLDDVETVAEVMRHMDDGTALRNVSLNRNRRKDGSVIHCAWYNSSLLDENGKKMSVYSQVLDRTKEVEALDALQEANKRKDEFLAMLSHELRNPLAPIRNSVEILRARGSTDAHMERATAIIDRHVAHMSRLIDDLLDVARITSGKIELRREVVKLSDVVEQAVECARAAADTRAQTLRVRCSDEVIRLRADRARLVQVLGNLLSNAVKFTSPNGGITVDCEKTENGMALVRVIDTGVGIPKELQPRVFELFAQEYDGLAREQGGLGIGLTLVKRLVELHGGTVGVRSEGRGRGSEFTVRLPMIEGDAVSEQESGIKQVRPAGETLRVLIVEDNLDAAESFRMLLELFGHDVRVVHDGWNAMRVLDEFVPDIAFMDLGLPGMDGFELAERFRADRRADRTVIVALTGYGRDEDKARARNAGFDHHMTKPIDLAALSSLINVVGVSVIPSRGSETTLH